MKKSKFKYIVVSTNLENKHFVSYFETITMARKWYKAAKTYKYYNVSIAKIIPMLFLFFIMSCASQSTPTQSKQIIQSFNPPTPCIPQETNPEKRSLVFFGDSQTYGSRYISETYAYKLAKNHPDFNFNMCAIGGTEFNHSQYQRLVGYNFKTNDIAIMLLGFNDVVYFGEDEANLELFRKNLDYAISKNQNIKFIIGTCIGAPDYTYEFMKLDGIMYGKDIQYGSRKACAKYAEATREIAIKYSNVTLIDTNKIFELQDSDLTDHVHFNDSVNERLKDLYEKYIL